MSDWGQAGGGRRDGMCVLVRNEEKVKGAWKRDTKSGIRQTRDRE